MNTRLINTVMEMSEPEFRSVWAAKLWQAMAKTGNGYRRDTTKNRPPAGAAGWRGERRKDKVGLMSTKLARRLAQRVQVA